MSQLVTEVLDRAGASAASAGLSRETVEAYSRHRAEPEWLRDARLAAWERYEALSKPTMRDEGWRRTDLSALDLERLAAPPNGFVQLASPDGAKPTGRDAARAGLLTLRNGHVHRAALDDRLASRGVVLTSLAEAVAGYPELVHVYLASERPATENKFAALSAALWDDGVFVYIPRGEVVDSPFDIVHSDDTSSAALTRTLIVADEGSGATLVESYAAPARRTESLSCGLVDVIVKQGAQFSCVQLQQRDHQCWSFASMRSEQERDSAVTWLVLGLGGRLSRTELACEVLGQGAEADLIGMVFGEDGQHFDFQTLQNHVGDDSRSDLLLKVALRDQATSNFTGLVRVGMTALRTSSNQENRNLLLSDQAKADSDPKLEILNSDVVRCGHGATVGPVDPEMIFYLMTRGLSHDEAERLIVEGFFQPLLARVPLEGVRKRLWGAIQRRLEK